MVFEERHWFDGYRFSILDSNEFPIHINESVELIFTCRYFLPSKLERNRTPWLPHTREQTNTHPYDAISSSEFKVPVTHTWLNNL